MTLKILLISVFSCFTLSAFSQCPTITTTANATNGTTPLVFCNNGTINLQTIGNLPAGSSINWYISTIPNFTPTQGTLIGNTNTTNGATCPRVCPSLNAVFINACGANEQDNEFIVFNSGSGFLASSLQVDIPNNGSAANSDINIGTTPCGLQTPTAAFIASLQATAGCSTIIAATPTTNIPAGAIVILFTSDIVTATYNFSSLCGQTVYIMQSNCHRTGGAFTNSASCSGTAATRLKTTTISIANCPTCSSHLTYSRCGIANLDGEFAVQVAGSDTASVRNGGILIDGTNPCNGPNFTALQLPPDTLRLTYNTTSLICNQAHYIRGILTPTPTGCAADVLTQTFEVHVICPQPIINGLAVVCGATNTLTADGLSPLGAPWTYNWATPSGSFTTSTVNGIQAGTYTVTVTSAGGCTGTASFSVTTGTGTITTPIITGANFICQNGSTTLTVNGVYPNYNWGNGNMTNSLSANSGGTYTITVSNANGCSATASVTVRQSGFSTINIGGNTSICNSQSEILTCNTTPSLATYVWNTGQTTQSITATQPIQYCVIATDNDGCTASSCVTVVSSGNLTPTILGQLQICENTLINTINLSAIYPTIAWTLPSGTVVNTTTINGNIPGLYSVTVSSVSGCTGTASFTISNYASLSPQILGLDFVCTGGSILLTATSTGGNRYLWNTVPASSAATIRVFNGGIYTVTVTKNASGCTATASTTIEDSVTPIPTVANIFICNGIPSALICNTTIGATALWDNGNTNLTNTISLPGNYCVTVSNIRGCTASTCAIVTAAASPIPTLTLSGNTNPCVNNPTTITVNETFTSYQWSFASNISNTLTTNIAGDYTVTVTNASGCTATISASVTVNSANLQAQATAIQPLCAGQTGSITLNPQGGTAPYTISLPILIGLAAGDYTVTVTDANACTASQTLTIVVPSPLTATLTPTNTYCGQPNGSIAILPQGGTAPYTFTPNILTALPAGDYTITITDANSCSLTATATLTATPPITATLAATPPNCYDEPTGIIAIPTINNAAPPVTVSIDNQPFTLQSSFVDVLPGLHTIRILDGSGCTWQDTITVRNAPPLTVNIGRDTTINLGDTLHLNAIVMPFSAVTYIWSFSSTQTQQLATYIAGISTPSGSGVSVLITDAKGCTATDNATIRVKEDPAIYIPNAFTPNGDGNNDVFVIYGGVAIKEIKFLRIFDRTGELVYEKTNFSPGTPTWDGVWERYREEYIPQPWGGDGGIMFKTAKKNAAIDVYAVYIELELINGLKRRYTSDLTLIR